MADFSHHIRALTPALRFMEARGFNPRDCLAGTDLAPADIDGSNAQAAFTLEQEFRFHRNLLEMTEDPLLGLALGQAYPVESYGLFGYAFLSAPSLRHALTIVQNYGLLSFSLFRIGFEVRGGEAVLRFSDSGVIPPDLLVFYHDRDLVAALHGGEVALQQSFELRRVRCLHHGQSRRAAYGEHFRCPVEFDQPHAELGFAATTLDQPMPMRDAQTSTLIEQQCDMLLARLSSGGGCVDQVRQLIVARPGYFPDIDFVAEKLNISSRTLRRRLAGENSSYQAILAEVRYQLAREYLSTSTLPLEEIAVLLGYSTAGNFTHAFKRWHGTSPRSYRQESR